MNSSPFVSCIMPTRNRREFVEQAVWYFLRQDYERRELVIVDDGQLPVAELVPDDPRIRTLRLDAQHSLGAKRNLACRAAQGELIAHWDDDDWQGPQRLSRQVGALQQSGAQVCGLINLGYYQLHAGRAWQHERPHPGTLLYERSLWLERPFSENPTHIAEFLERIPTSRQHALEEPALYVAILHGNNFHSLSPKPPKWRQMPLAELTDHIGHDIHFYIGMRDKSALANGVGLPRVRPASNGMHASTATITLVSHFMIYDGYGSMAEYLAIGMQRAGADVRIQPLMIDWEGLSSEFQSHFRQSRVNGRSSSGDPLLYFSPVDAVFNRYRATDNLFTNTMWESSRLPENWVARLNCSRAVIVPTHFVARACRESGVTAPIEIIPEGIDPAVYQYIERPVRDRFTTLIVGPIADRKHTREAIAAWQMAFEDDSDARLVIKARFGYSRQLVDDPRVHLVDTNETTRGIAHWYQRADALLALGSEGFGLPLVEGMATGLPVVALDSEGQADVCRAAPSAVLAVAPAGYRPYDDQRFGRCGEQAIPDIEQAATHLRWIRDNPEQAADLGRRASAWARRERDSWRKGPAVLGVMERHMRTPLPLRRQPTIWVPSLGKKCGVAEYTRHLTRGLAGIKITAGLDDWRGVRLLHMQHEYSLFTDTQALSAVQQGNAKGTPVIITEHSVMKHLSPWEREASALVALTSSGAAELRRKWPGRQVEHIPIGCHTWFPPRKRRRGQVIGVFGFLGRHKGYWDLLHVLRRVPGASLRMFSHSHSPALMAEWQRDSADLPVEHVTDYLTEKSIAGHLASEVDVVVFWYSEMAHFSASAAVCVGLASGVPVLTSPTHWFQDLKEVTYQPEQGLDGLVNGVQRLLEDTPLRRELVEAAREYCEANSWQVIADRHMRLWQSLM